MSFQQHPDIQEILLREQSKGELRDWDKELAQIRKSLNNQFNGPSSIDQIQAERARETALNKQANDFLRQVERDQTARRLEQDVPRTSPSMDATRARQAQADQQAADFRRQLQRNQAATWEEWNAPEPGTPARSPRVSRPSTGGPPPSPRVGGQPFYPPDDPLNFRTGEPRQAYSIPDAPTMRPSSSPQPVPRRASGPSLSYPVRAGAAGAVAGAVASGALGIALGAPPGQAVGGAIGGAVGGVGGAVVGGLVGSFLGGPVGTAIGAQVGGVIGGFIGSGIGGFLGGQFDRPSSAESVSLPTQGMLPPPFLGGQSQTTYDVSFAYDVTSGSGSPVPMTGMLQAFGKILSIQLQNGPSDSPDVNRIRLSYIANTTGEVINSDTTGGNYPTFKWSNLRNINVVRTDRQPDTGGNLPSPGLAPPIVNPQGRNQLVVDLSPTGSPAGTPNAQGAPIARPSGSPAGNNARGDSPDWVPSGYPNPRVMPSPEVIPRPPMSGLPETVAPPATKPASKPTDADKRQPSPGNAGGGFFNPLSPALLIPVAATQLARPSITPTRYRGRHPGIDPETPPIPDPSASPCRGNGCGGANLRQSQQNADYIRAMQAQLMGMQSQLALAGIGVDAVGNAAIMAKLNALDAKLGPQIPNGGIANFIKKTWDFLQIDRILSVLTFIGVLHNAYFLSNSLAQTLFSAIGNSLAVFGVTNSEGQPLEVGSIVSKFTDQFFKSIFGVEEVDGFKAAWKKYNRIYQAAANVISSVQSLVYSVQAILEVIGQNVSKIGNALKAWGSVSDRAYGWMSENSSKTGILGAFDRVRDKTQAIEEITSNIDGVASEVLGARETLAEFEKQTEELRKLQAEGVPKPQIENIPIKQLNEAQKAVSVSPPISSSDLVKPEV